MNNIPSWCASFSQTHGIFDGGCRLACGPESLIRGWSRVSFYPLSQLVGLWPQRKCMRRNAIIWGFLSSESTPRAHFNWKRARLMNSAGAQSVQISTFRCRCVQRGSSPQCFVACNMVRIVLFVYLEDYLERKRDPIGRTRNKVIQFYISISPRVLAHIALIAPI